MKCFVNNHLLAMLATILCATLYHVNAANHPLATPYTSYAHFDDLTWDSNGQLLTSRETDRNKDTSGGDPYGFIDDFNANRNPAWITVDDPGHTTNDNRESWLNQDTLLEERISVKAIGSETPANYDPINNPSKVQPFWVIFYLDDAGLPTSGPHQQTMGEITIPNSQVETRIWEASSVRNTHIINFSIAWAAGAPPGGAASVNPKANQLFNPLRLFVAILLTVFLPV